MPSRVDHLMASSFLIIQPTPDARDAASLCRLYVASIQLIKFPQLRFFKCCPHSPVARPLGRHVQYSVTCAVFRWFEVRFEPRPG